MEIFSPHAKSVFELHFIQPGTDEIKVAKEDYLASKKSEQSILLESEVDAKCRGIPWVH